MVGYLVLGDSLIAFYLQYAVHTITDRISPILYCRIDISTIKRPRNATPTRKYSTGFMQAGNTKPIGQFGVTKFHVYCFFSMEEVLFQGPLEPIKSYHTT